MPYLHEAAHEYAIQHGRLDTTRAWINTPLDSWEPNPFYIGPRVAHPEADPEYAANGDYFEPIGPVHPMVWEF